MRFSAGVYGNFITRVHPIMTDKMDDLRMRFMYLKVDFSSGRDREGGNHYFKAVNEGGFVGNAPKTCGRARALADCRDRKSVV